MSNLRGLDVDRIFPRTLPMDNMIPTQPNTVDALDSKPEHFYSNPTLQARPTNSNPTVDTLDSKPEQFTRTGRGFTRTGSGFTRNWSVCLVLPVYGIVVCLVVWNMHLQAQLLLMRTDTNLNVSPIYDQLSRVFPLFLMLNFI